jgi:hypothetical protein
MDKIKTKKSVYGHCIYWEDIDVDGVKSTTNIYSDHLHNVRRTKGIIEQEELLDHELLGKKFMYDGKECVVDKVNKQWYLGYYELITYYSLSETKTDFLCTDVIDGVKYGRSHGTAYVKNISCHYPTITDNIKDFDFYE